MCAEVLVPPQRMCTAKFEVVSMQATYRVSVVGNIKLTAHPLAWLTHSV